MSRKKRQKTEQGRGTTSQAEATGMTAAATAPNGAAAAAASSSSTSSKRPRPTSPPQPEGQGSKKPRTDAPPNDALAGDSTSASDAAAAGPSNTASRPSKRPRPLLRIQRRNLVAGPFNPGGGYSYLTLRVDGGNGSGEVTAAALGDTFRATLHQHLGLVGGSVPFDVLSIDSRRDEEDSATSSSRQRRATALVRISLQYAREVRAALVLGGGGGAGKIRLGLDGSQEETGSVWTLRSQVWGGEGGSTWMRRLEERLLA